MTGRISRHLRSNVVGYLALFIALSGTAWAAGRIGPNDIKNDAVLSRHIKDGEVKSGDIGTGQVTRADVANDNTSRALTGRDIAHDSLGAGDIGDGIGLLQSVGEFDVNPSLSQTQTVTLLSDNDLVVRGSCQRGGSNAMTAKLLVSTNIDNAIFTSSATPNGFIVNTADGDKEVGTLAEATGTFDYGLISFAGDDPFADAMQGIVSGAVNTPTNGPNDCVFTGAAIG